MLKHFRTKSSHTYRKCDCSALKSRRNACSCFSDRKQHSNGSNTNEQIKRHLYFSRMAQQRGFRQINCYRALAEPRKNAFRVTRPMFSKVVWVPRNDLVETSTSSCLVICRRAFRCRGDGFAVYENEIQARCFLYRSVH